MERLCCWRSLGEVDADLVGAVGDAVDGHDEEVLCVALVLVPLEGEVVLGEEGWDVGAGWGDEGVWSNVRQCSCISGSSILDRFRAYLARSRDQTGSFPGPSMPASRWAQRPGAASGWISQPLVL